MIVDCGQVKPLHMPRNNNKRAGEHAEAALCALCFVFRFLVYQPTIIAHSVKLLLWKVDTTSRITGCR